MTPSRIFVADDKFGDVIEELTRRGWRRFPHLAFPKFDLKWSNYSKIAWRRVAPTQRVNHLEHATLLSRKDALARRLYRMPPSCSVDAFYLRTFDLGDPRDRLRLRARYLYCRALGVLKGTSSGAEACAQCAALIDSALALLESVIAAGDGLEGPHPPAMEEHVDNVMARQRCERPCRGCSSAQDERIQRALDALRQWDPQYEAVEAGHGDVWICKPSNLSQGRGIQLLTSLDDILALAPSDQVISTEHAATKTTNAVPDGQGAPPPSGSWVVQKYLERPLLLRAQSCRKFDIRQWVLITSLSPLCVYWYNSCYLRFCSAPFTLHQDDAWTHLSNYSIQQHAPPAADGDDPMWSSARFQRELRDELARDVWQESLVPQMQHAALTAIRSVLGELSMVGRGFEWLGIDFVVDSSLRAWLLEVNPHETP
ncbi:hypothetical protein ATCC90586_005785 [Pythium insidiosum]|nr:hypothetical protein ATCC90586_005785 [Pythium insidiosum]